MNGQQVLGLLTKVGMVLHPSQRFLFVEECASQNPGSGQNSGNYIENLNAWDMNPGDPNGTPPFGTANWVDSTAAFHGVSSTFSFVDGHSESRKWIDSRVVAFGNSMNAGKYGQPNGGGGPEAVAADNAKTDLNWWRRTVRNDFEPLRIFAY